MSIAIDSMCLECHLSRALKTVRPLGDEQTAVAFAKALMGLYLSAPEGVSSPWFGPGTAALMQTYYGLDPDRYREEKRLSNAFVMERLDAVRAQVENAPDPVFAALQFAILGNYLDFAALQGQVSFEKLDEMLRQALKMELDDGCYRALCADLAKGKRLLYLTDNAGDRGKYPAHDHPDPPLWLYYMRSGCPVCLFVSQRTRFRSRNNLTYKQI